jgi:hypothetical protein
MANLNCLIVSSFFWPIEGANFNLPPALQQVFGAYEEFYTDIKQSRKLCFHDQLGCVSLTLDFENGSRTWDDVTPLHASIISLFHDNDEWRSAEELAEALGLDATTLKKEISIWESRGILQKQAGDDTFYYCPVKVIK